MLSERLKYRTCGMKSHGRKDSWSGALHPKLKTLRSRGRDKLIASRLDQILEEVVATHGVQKEQARVLEDRFEYLKQASRRLGRKDWILVAIGIFGGTLSNYLLPPAALRQLFNALVSLIREIVNIKLLLP